MYHPAPGSPTVEGGSMHLRFVSTDYSNLILYVRFEDDEITSLWVLLGKWPALPSAGRGSAPVPR